jgi:hypothetical protein
MTNLITGIIGIAGVLAFLGILLWWIKAPPLIIICAIVMLLLLHDFVSSFREAPSASVGQSAFEKMLLGGAVCGISLAVTIGTYSAALATPGAGYYILAWGAFVWGAVLFFVNLTKVLRGQS